MIGHSEKHRSPIRNTPQPLAFRGTDAKEFPILSLHEADLISYDEALRNADSVNDVRLRLKLESKTAKTGELGDTLRNVTYK